MTGQWMKLRRIETESFRGVPDGRYEFASSDDRSPHDLVLVTGPARSGKTSLLEAIAGAKEAAGSYGAPVDPRRALRVGTTRGRAKATWVLAGGEEIETVWELGDGARIESNSRLQRLFGTYSRDPSRGKFEFFPANRRLFGESWRPLAPSPTEASEARLRLSTDPEKYTVVRRVLLDLAQGDALEMAETLATRGIIIRGSHPDSLAPIRKALRAMIPDLSLHDVNLNARGVIVRFERRHGGFVELEDLSDSEQQAVLFCTTFVQLGLSNSVVLIDTPEASVHPSEQASFFSNIVTLGQGNQIIAATASEAILRTVQPNQVVTLKEVG